LYKFTDPAPTDAFGNKLEPAQSYSRFTNKAYDDTCAYLSTPDIRSEDFVFFMSTTVYVRIPQYAKYNFRAFVQRVSFLRFCRDSDDLATSTDTPPGGRIQLETAYVQTMFEKVDRMTDEDAEALVGVTKQVKSARQARVRMMDELRNAMKKVR